MRLRGEIIERTFAHVLETGGMARLYLCHQENIANGCWCTLPVTPGSAHAQVLRRWQTEVSPGPSAALWAALVTLWNLLVRSCGCQGTPTPERSCRHPILLDTPVGHDLARLVTCALNLLRVFSGFFEILFGCCQRSLQRRRVPAVPPSRSLHHRARVHIDGVLLLVERCVLPSFIFEIFASGRTVYRVRVRPLLLALAIHPCQTLHARR